MPQQHGGGQGEVTLLRGQSREGDQQARARDWLTAERWLHRELQGAS